MEKRYSEYSYGELRSEVALLKEKALKAEQLGMVNEYAVYERKITMAKAYMLDPEDFDPQTEYEIEGDPAHTFYIEYLNGVFAWGYRKGITGERAGKKEEALPISMIGKRIKE
ncbi:YfhH family protein [Halobacillus sp. A1]|uniref:YfhH family protein n=1 Tax=Halobacillus campisalis TaxID=435909 RepID=A0ABW2K293_9BACI|nr:MULTISPECIES: YfhH family protein [Halobacillus]MCP3033403.1 YfhH family protein [Halobacillus sp. A1]